MIEGLTSFLTFGAGGGEVGGLNQKEKEKSQRLNKPKMVHD